MRNTTTLPNVLSIDETKLSILQTRTAKVTAQKVRGKCQPQIYAESACSVIVIEVMSAGEPLIPSLIIF
jgi:hypothetical protein